MVKGKSAPKRHHHPANLLHPKRSIQETEEGRSLVIAAETPPSCWASRGCECVRNAGLCQPWHHQIRTHTHSGVTFTHSSTLAAGRFLPTWREVGNFASRGSHCCSAELEAPRAYLGQPLLILLPAVVGGQAVVGLVPGDGPRAPWRHHWKKPTKHKSDLLLNALFKKKKAFKINGTAMYVFLRVHSTLWIWNHSTHFSSLKFVLETKEQTHSFDPFCCCPHAPHISWLPESCCLFQRAQLINCRLSWYWTP